MNSKNNHAPDISYFRLSLFDDEVPEDTAKDLALKPLPECEPVFANYPLTDGFAYLKKTPT
jgi:hypothetical protein